MRRIGFSLLVACCLAGCGRNPEPMSSQRPDEVVNSDQSAPSTEAESGSVQTDAEPKDATKWTSENEDGSKVTMETGGEPTEDQLGLPLYPQSKRISDDPGDIVLVEKGVKTVSIVTWTSDPIPKILDFYRKKIMDMDELETGDGALMMGVTDSGSEATILLSKETNRVRIQVSVVTRSI